MPARRTALFALLILCVPCAVFAADTLSVVEPWSRATPPGATVGAVYFEIVNSTAVADSLLRVSSASADHAEMHTVLHEEGLAKMRPMTQVDVPAGQRVRFEPGAMHVMLLKLKQPLKEGDRVPVTLTFQRAGEIKVEAVVLGMGAMKQPAAPAGHQHHP